MKENYFLNSCSFFLQAFPIIPYNSDSLDMKQRRVIGMQCLKQVGVDRRVIDRTVATLEFPVNDQKYKDFLACSYKKQGFQSEDGKILYENIYEYLSRYYSLVDLKILDVCKSTTGANDGERAFNAVVCIMDKLKTLEDKQENDI